MKFEIRSHLCDSGEVKRIIDRFSEQSLTIKESWGVEFYFQGREEAERFAHDLVANDISFEYSVNDF